MFALSAQEFWKWFTEHDEELFNFETDRENVFDQLAKQLNKIDPNLTFEIGPVQNGKREFVISAGGIKQAFPIVAALVDAAPGFERWQIIAFRPRRTTLNIVDFRGKRIHPKDVKFSLLHNGKMAGIYLFIPGYRQDDSDIKQIGYLLLDDALGEYDVENRIGLVEMFPSEIETDDEQYPLSELPQRFDKLMRQLESGRITP